MSVLVVGLSHKSAPLATLERAVVTGDALGKLSRDVFHAESVAGSFVISTCNRAEIYADVDKFHDGVSAICELLARHTGIPPGQLTPHLYVHYEDRAAQHLLAVACGLDSMVIGESQILGQVRQALNMAREQATLSRALSDLGAVALRAGKRVRAETGIDRSGASLASVGLSLAAARLRGAPGPGSLAGLSVLVVGAGAMSSIAVAAAARMGAAGIVVANRGHARARRLAATVSATSADLSRLPAEIAAADLVVSCTGAPGVVITAECAAQALSARAAGRPLVMLDLAVPRDVEPGAGRLPGVTLIGLDELREAVPAGLPGAGHDEQVAAAWRIVAEEFAAQLSADRAARVAPTVVALRAKAAGVVAAELARLDGRLGSLDAPARREIAQSMSRVADKLLHAPTVRVKELAGSPGADSYELALRVLFDLDPDAVRAVVRADQGLLPAPDDEEGR
ncbi:MAG: glutamyl-tRNA reductase [Streptosporangiaceae bacterium]|jgi:glutamyl-tRNA reductase